MDESASRRAEIGRRAGAWCAGLAAAAAAALALVAGGCNGGSGGGSDRLAATAESCMTCHNGSPHDDYAGPGLEDPHPYGEAAGMLCTTCHGGNPAGETALSAHVPPPPGIGDRAQQEQDPQAWFNRLTLTGIDKLPDYEVGGKSYSAIDYLQFVNPGDLRVVTLGRSCGDCHEGHAECVAGSMLATGAGVLSGGTFAIGVDNAVPESRGLFEDTAADLAFRAAVDPDHDAASAGVGEVARLLEHPVFSVRGAEGPDAIYRNDAYAAAELDDDIGADGRVLTGSPLANLYHEQLAFTCGDCHLGSAGANNRYGDFRSSGCTACHMPYSLDGRSRTGDPNVDRFEPLDPDEIEEPERSHPRRHLLLSVAKSLPSGEPVPGIDDHTCAGCHQGSNRTVMQYWGIRLDQNADLKRGVQYPANPVDWEDTRHDTRLFDPVVDNDTFNGRKAEQYIAFEDYDGDGRDDTPPDVHHEAGMGCIDCHGSYDLHGGDVAAGVTLHSRMEQAVGVACESCHGTADAYAGTMLGTAWHGEEALVAVDRKGQPLRNVVKESHGTYWLRSRLTGAMHYVTQTRDTVVDSGKTHPVRGGPIYSAKASYAMGRADGNPATGIGPLQAGSPPAGFSHADSMDCAACHSSWQNSCIGCHLSGEYDEGFNFSNITGERIVFEQRDADFVYQSPLPFQLGVAPGGKISPISANTDVFFYWRDRQNQDSRIFSFSDRNAKGANKALATHPALSHNVMMAHSIRGKVTPKDEGPRYCAACHLTDSGLASFGAEYEQLRGALASPTLEGLDLPLFQTLQTHIGRNPGNQLDSPLWVHMVAGLGSGLFLFDEHGCPINALDSDDDRVGCDGTAPKDAFDLSRVVYNLDRIVDESGFALGSNNHPMMTTDGQAALRDGADDPGLSGPLGATLIERLTDPDTGIVLDSWIDADGEARGSAADFLDED